MRKISELLVDYSLNTPPAKVGLKTAKEFLAQHDIRDENVFIWKDQPQSKKEEGGSNEN